MCFASNKMFDSRIHYYNYCVMGKSIIRRLVNKYSQKCSLLISIKTIYTFNIKRQSINYIGTYKTMICAI